MTERPTLTDAERDELVAYLDGELDPAAARRWEERLRGDARLRAEADAYQRTWALLDQLPKVESSPGLASRTLERLTAAVEERPVARRPADWLNRAAWIGALAAAAVLGYWAVPSPRLEVDVDRDPIYRAEPRLIENLPLYLAVENAEFLHLLDAHDLFGEEGTGR
jgi:anti-sigma factor RsiW